MTVLGQVVLVLAGVFSLGAAAGYGRNALGRTGSLALPRLVMALGTTLILIASAILTAQILSHDFTNGYVYGHSDRSLPLHLLLSTFYAGQEGSFLFWALCSALIAVGLSGYARKRGSEAEVMTVFLLVQSILIALTIVKTPFESIWSMYEGAPAGQVPVDGRGLNPLLQNIWMISHPPILFVGFALMAVPFSQTIAALWRRKMDLLVEQGLGWTLLSVSVLGLGIMLGAYWAYGVLGWGGYWGWDPVENSSLVPWLTGIALVHTILAQRRTGKYLRTNFALAVISYCLIIYSTFLTRSGILGDASVHAFSDAGAGIYWLLLSFMAAILLSGFGMMALRRADLRPAEAGGSGWLTRETMLAAGAIAILLSAVVILFGTSLPIFSTIRVEPSFYDTTNLPLAVLMALLIGVSLYTQWEEHDVRYTVRRMWVALLAAVLATGVLMVLGMDDVGTSGLVLTAFFALFVNVDVGARIITGDPLFLGGKIAHVGLAVFFLGVVAAGKYSSTEHVSLPRGTPVAALGHTLTYTGFTVTPDQKYVFDVQAQSGSDVRGLAPVMFDAGNQGIMRNPDIVSDVMRDVYFSPLALEPPSEGTAQQEIMLTKETPHELDGVTVVFTGFERGDHATGDQAGKGMHMDIGAVLEITRGKERETVKPRLVYTETGPQHVHVPSTLLGGDVELKAMNISMNPLAPSEVTIGIARAGAEAARPDVLVGEVSIKPFISLVWAGTVLMMVGFGLAITKRWRE